MKSKKKYHNEFRRIMRKFGFPFLLLAYSIGLSLYPSEGTLILLGFAIIGILMENWMPYHKDWRGIKNDSKLDGVFSILTMIVSVIVKGGLTVLFSQLSFGSHLWPTIPLPLSILLALLISGFGPYILHRAAHEWNDFLWQIHAVHHAPNRVYSLNAMRAHPLNAAWNVVTGLGPLLLLGADSETILIAGGLNNFFSIFNHMNIDFKNVQLSIFLNTAELHRWHHSAKKDFGDRNYSSGAITLWDHVFGSWKLPRTKFNRQDAGLYATNDFPILSLSRQLIGPLCRCL
ncbi:MULTISPECIES: sterol desaturase family protein [unclassified Leptospira]|uniref:sterol desaturase family protein n=1 Tax=unclassified Leptospira TaxID=2633828 RepID=UPI0002BFD9E8|nr:MULTISPECIES: sterol desaturase family protein [unclassified Leptospira]EMK01975.1 fatty acid hydroxylase family protein [Leptospira sp. B5-022]MCR1793809.1 sterol desaturase family protein [Leptospira sp. id769339]